MGYYTKFDLSSNTVTEEQFTEELKKMYPQRWPYGPFNDTCKWYEHEEDCKAISKILGNAVFTISGNGEDSPDFWKRTYQNGEQIEYLVGEVVYRPCID